jgi:Calcineurin-like phosphoesterase
MAFGRGLLGLGAALLVLAGSAARAEPPAGGQPVAAWVQLVDGGVAEARAVVEGPSCPEASVDGEPRSMRVRVGPDAAAFPQTVCSLALPKGAHAVSVGGRVLPPPPPARIDRMVVIGDTGCRIHGAKLQSCNDPRAWPFGLVARLAAAEKPDLVIHVGDYYYRETACPPEYTGCADSPHGDIWPSWQADFFDPARPLLDAAPWVFARGNHEDCQRGGKGWFRMLEASAQTQTCQYFSPVFSVPIGGVTLHILDSANAEDRVSTPTEVRLVGRQIETLPRGSATHDDWIVTHRPFWGEAPAFSLGPLGVFNVGINRTEQIAAQGKDLSAVAMILSGHIHHFASFGFGDQRPAQLVVGTGGDVGEPFDPAKISASQVYIDGMEAETLTFQRYGYFVLERAAAGWTGLFKDLDGKPVARCTLVGRNLGCGGVK